MSIKPFLDALGVAASQPLAMVGFLAALVVAGYLAARAQRSRALLSKIKDLPPGDRRLTLQAEMNVVLPKSISAEQWLRSRVYTLYFGAFTIIALCVTLISVLLIINTYSKTGSVVEAKPIIDAGPVVENDTIDPPPSTKIFDPARLNGRPVDSCVLSAGSEGDAEACSSSAKKVIADTFCQEKGYDHSTAWTASFDDEPPPSYKLRLLLRSDGERAGEFVAQDRGGELFSTITCEDGGAARR